MFPPEDYNLLMDIKGFGEFYTEQISSIDHVMELTLSEKNLLLTNHDE